ncbi:MAG TPA: cupredoxin domain-containing protein [Armatimonadota bacterium]|nr:cupredoxin domain-containing protein [Armatimonadota bacterium]HOM80667.1 cupredoxin domain-containing protein [Armatimonadota bacterium]
MSEHPETTEHSEHVERSERSPWPWVVLALGLLAFTAAVFFLTRPAQLAPPEGGSTTVIQPGSSPEGPDQRVTVEQDGRRDGEAPTGTEATPPANAPAAPGSPQPAPPRESAPSTAPANQPAQPGGAGQPAPGNRSGVTPSRERQTTTVNVEMGEWFVRLDPATAPPGRVQFRIRNTGSAIHGFEIDGPGVEERSERLDPGEDTVVVANLGPGEYEIYCYVGDHRERGMETRMRVTEE